jgi:hypothetical protein
VVKDGRKPESLDVEFPHNIEVSDRDMDFVKPPDGGFTRRSQQPPASIVEQDLKEFAGLDWRGRFKPPFCRFHA